MRLVVDAGRCMGHGQCEVVAPELFQVGEDGIAILLDDHPPSALEPQALEACVRCPEVAIRADQE